MLLEPDVITKEVKGVFGEDARVDIKFSANIDGYFIEVHKKVGNEILMVSACIPAKEELEGDPLAVLRQYIGYMYYYFMQALEQDSGATQKKLPSKNDRTLH